MSVLYESALIHPSAYWTAKVTDTAPWKYLALEEGPHGTTQLQRLLYHISKPTFQGFVCPLCNSSITTTWFNHLCRDHTVTLYAESLKAEDVITLLSREAGRKLFDIKFPKLIMLLLYAHVSQIN